MLEENLFSKRESALASQKDFSFPVRFVVSLFFYSECGLVLSRLFLFSNGFCTNQLSILFAEKNRFEIKKIILNGFKIAGFTVEPVNSLSLPNKHIFI